MSTAHDILTAAQGHMQDRAATYDKPEGERSIAATVKAFNAVTGDGLMNTEERGWLFMLLLKAVRSQQGDYRADNYEDGAAYFALAGEAAARDRKQPDIRELYSEEDEKRMDVVGQSGERYMGGHELYNEEELAAWEEGEKRMDQIGPNGNDGIHYWHINHGSAPDIDPATWVIVEYRNGEREEGGVASFDWSYVGSYSPHDIARWRLA